MVVHSASVAETAVADKAGAGTQVSHKVELLRQEMAKADHGKGVQAYIIPTEDPHMVRICRLCIVLLPLYLDFAGAPDWWL